jgi:hypothetical protein
LDEVMNGARRRAGLAHATCHELRHTCLTRLREAGMALEAVQAQAGRASIESTRIYLHLADDWLAAQYRTAAEAIDAQMLTRPAAPAGAASPVHSVPSVPVSSAFTPRPVCPGPGAAARSLRALRGPGREGIRGSGRGGAR